MQLLQGRKVIVIDDQETIQKTVCKMVQCFGPREVLTAENGASALKVLKKTKVDLIISDWEMPVINGLTLLHAVRADQFIQTTKFIMLTGANGRDFILKAVKLGVDDYIVKPVTIEVLAEKIKACLDPKNAVEMDLYHQNIGDFALDQGDLDQAIIQFSESLKHNPGNSQALMSLGEAHSQKGMTAEAVEDYNKALEIKPDNPEILFHMSKAYLANQNKAMASQALRRALEIDPEFKDAKELLLTC
ncbi:MAG: response regulator [Candidatus Hydrothermarchaeaceae archaeon]